MTTAFLLLLTHLLTADPRAVVSATRYATDLAYGPGAPMCLGGGGPDLDTVPAWDDADACDPRNTPWTNATPGQE